METPKTLKNNNINKIPKPRPFTSKPRLNSNKKFNNKSRPITSKPQQKNRPFSSNPYNKNNVIKNPLLISKTQMIGMQTNMDFRTIRQASSYQDKVFNKYWESTQTEPKSIIPFINNSNFNKDFYTNKNYNTPLERILKGDRNLYKFPQIDWSNKTPNTFLTNVGGINFNLSLADTRYTSRPETSKFENILMKVRPLTAIDKLKKRINTQSNQNTLGNIANNNINKKMARPTTAMPNLNKNINNLNNKDNIPLNVKNKLAKNYMESYQYTDSFFNEEDDLENYDKFEYNKQQIIQEEEKNYPHVENLMKHYNLLNVKNYSIKTAQADTDLLEIFDRSQRTNSATLAKVGDYEYYTSYQRIGSFMDYSEHMKWEDLLNIQKHVLQTKNNMIAYQSKHNIQPPNRDISLVNVCPHFNDPNSLLHGFMPFEYEGDKMISEFNKINHSYEPIDFLPKYKSDLIFDESLYNEDFSRLVVTSITNYNKYLNSSKITYKDLKKFNKNALRKKIINKINFKFTEVYKKLLNENLSEIEQLYYYTLKQIIMNYILRSPNERKRLNIVYYPRKVLPSSYTIAQYGSFNRNKYSEWVDNYTNAFNFLEKNLSLCNIEVSGLIDWTQNFNHINLVYLKNIDSLKDKENKCIQIDEFCKIQESYMNKVLRFLRDIYYRGAILITKKNKCLKRKELSSLGRWTFKGFITDTEEYEDDYENMLFGMNYEDQLNDFWTNVELDDLIDIRLTPSNIAYVTYMLHDQIDTNISNYEKMSTEAKIKLNNSVTAYCTIFFRKLTEKALNDIFNFFDEYPSNLNLFKQTEAHEYLQGNYVKDLEYDEKDIKLPDLLTFKITHLVEPLISIKTKYDNLYNLVKLEYNFDQAYEKLIKIIDNLCNLFNSICTTHFLEFKKILPSQREKIAKEHSSKLNDYFNSDPNQNKSFLEDYFKNLCPNLIVEEVETENYMKSYLNIINVNETIISDIKSKIYRKMKIQYSEIEECLKVFEPLKELITNSFDENIKTFTDIYNAMPDYLNYMKFLDKISTFKTYISIIPDKLQYSMFAIDTRETKRDLKEKLENDKKMLLKSLEDMILVNYNNNIEKFGKLLILINKKLNTPEEVVEMEKTKNKVNMDVIGLVKDFDESHKIFLFLIKSNDIFSEDMINKIAEGIKSFYKFKSDSEAVEKMHKENIEFLENKFKKEREEVEEDINKFLNEINMLDNQTHINEYENVIATLIYLEEKIPKLKERIDRTLLDEKLLFEYINEGFDKFNFAKGKLDKLGILWRNIQNFYEERKVLIHNFSEEVDIDHYIENFSEINSIVSNNKKGLRKEEEIISKMSRILEDDIENIIYFLKIIQKVIDSPKPMSEDLRRDVMEVLENKAVEQSCREILFTYFSKKD